MCDGFYYAVGVILWQRVDKKLHLIYCASHNLNVDQLNYAINKKEFFAVIFDFEKFWSYTIGSYIVVYTDHSAFKHLLFKKDAKPRLVRWDLLS